MKRLIKQNRIVKREVDELSENLGLDADHSSELNELNNDNDRITGNPNGENDERDEDGHSINTPIDEK